MTTVLRIRGNAVRLWAALVLAALLFGCATPSPLREAHDEAGRHNQDGLLLLEEGRLPAAIEQFSQAIGLLEPALQQCEAEGTCETGEVSVLRHNLALAYANRAYAQLNTATRASDTAALGDAEKALALNPELNQPHQYRAIIAIRRLDAETSWREYEYLRERDPAFAEKLFEAYQEAFGPRIDGDQGIVQ